MWQYDIASDTWLSLPDLPVDHANNGSCVVSDTGYLYEYRWQDEYRFEDLGDDLAPYAARFEPRTRREDAPAALYGPIREMIRAIASASPDDLEAALAPHLDVRGFLRHAAVENYLSEWDGLVGYAGLDNFYLYRPREGHPAQLIAWDKDMTFLWPQMPPAHNLDGNVLTWKAWRVPELRSFYLESLLEAAAAADTLAPDAAVS